MPVEMLDEYQNAAIKTMQVGHSVTEYLALGIASEAGEVAGKVKKRIRDGNISDEDIIDEIGDVLWYCAVLSHHLGYPLGRVARRNIVKLKSRAERGVIGGSGESDKQGGGDMGSRFEKCTSLAEAKKLYRELMMSCHPDRGGSTEEAQMVNAEFDAYCSTMMKETMEGQEHAKKYRHEEFADILKKAIRLNCRIEIIGFWIYAFESFAVKDELQRLGFWFSAKHKAWVYSGTVKHRTHSKLGLNDIRRTYGCEVVRDVGEVILIQ